MNQPDGGGGRGNAPQPAPEDRFSYRLAVAAIGVGLITFLIGAAVIAADGKPVPTQYWATGSAISGALLGILSPTPTTTKKPEPKQLDANASSLRKSARKVSQSRFGQFFGALVHTVEELWSNRELFVLLTVFGVSIAFAITKNSAPLETVAAAAGGSLVGLFAPPPKQTKGTEKEAADAKKQEADG
jgi:hypothetical protein